MSADFEAPEARQLVQTIAFLSERGHFGYAGLDSGYRAIWRYGGLASWIPLRANVCQHTDLFFGLEKELLDLQDEHGDCMTLPRVGIPSGGDDGAKISVETFWDDRASVYHVVVHRLVAESEVELELLKQIRARRLAEENFQSTTERLARKQMLLDIIMEHLPVAAAIFDDRRRYLFATRRWAHDFQLACEPLLGQDFLRAGPAVPDSEKRRFEASLAGLASRPEIDTLTAGADVMPGYRWTHKGWTHPEDARGGVLTTVEDMSGILAENRRLASANEQLRAANQQLARFASIISHDLNAPLRSLLGLVEGIEAAGPATDESALPSRIRDHVERMKNMLDGMHDYLQVLCFGPAARPVNVAALVREIVGTLPDGEAFGLELSLKAEEITLNAGVLDLVLRNLLDNAVKHHDRACGCLSVSLDEDEDTWLMAVEDDGPGIPLREQGAFREGRFWSALPECKGGGGKGLPIVRRAIDGIGGTIDVQSDPSRKRGTKFIIRWPKKPSYSADITQTG
jgi:signal transduction histidine kinase